MKSNLYIPKKYKPLLDLRETEKAIGQIKTFFQTNLSFELELMRVTAPLFVRAGTGINDDLNGIEQPVSFNIHGAGNVGVEMVQSLAKWKRMMLADYGVKQGHGLCADMNAIRPDDMLDNTHSIYVDQWDWERVIRPEDRTLDYLKDVVRDIYRGIKQTEEEVARRFPSLRPFLPDEIRFVHTEELARRYGDLTSWQREEAVCRELGAVFLIGIGGDLGDGRIHDGRAPDYDDWTTPTGPGTRGLNGDLFVWYPLLGIPLELSSMGIRVDPETMLRQLAVRNCPERAELPWHKLLLDGHLPATIGGGIGQSRLCMLLMQRAHIGEVQVGLWPADTVNACRQAGIQLL